MNFMINHGTPGAWMIVLIVLSVAGLVIFARFLLSVIRSAHDDVIDADQDNSLS